nr:hypothetical protein [Haemophilus parahaemolyticus]
MITKEATARLGCGFLDQFNYGGSIGYATGDWLATQAVCQHYE